MAKELRQIDQLIDHTGAYFQEEMWQIVSVLVYPITLIRIFLIIAHLLFCPLISQIVLTL